MPLTDKENMKYLLILSMFFCFNSVASQDEIKKEIQNFCKGHYSFKKIKALDYYGETGKVKQVPISIYNNCISETKLKYKSLTLDQLKIELSILGGWARCNKKYPRLNTKKKTKDYLSCVNKEQDSTSAAFVSGEIGEKFLCMIYAGYTIENPKDLKLVNSITGIKKGNLKIVSSITGINKANFKSTCPVWYKAAEEGKRVRRQKRNLKNKVL